MKCIPGHGDGAFLCCALKLDAREVCGASKELRYGFQRRGGFGLQLVGITLPPGLGVVEDGLQESFEASEFLTHALTVGAHEFRIVHLLGKQA